jgi:hypothetical protein
MLDEIPFDYNEEVNRRIEQFANWIRKMSGRRRRVKDTNCFLIFDEEDPAGDAPVAKLSRAKSLVCAGGGFDDGMGCDGDDPPQEESGGQSEDNGRFVQFKFEKELFWMELPNTTLSRPEGERIMRNRPGFFWLKDNPGYAATRLDEPFDPMTKFYLYGDEQRAGEDVAHIFFQQWKFPVTCRLFVKAACFEGPDFEWGLLIQ